MKKILFAASESVPFIKTGGLADVVGSLPKWFDKKEYDVRVIIPKYMCNSHVLCSTIVKNIIDKSPAPVNDRNRRPQNSAVGGSR